MTKDRNKEYQVLVMEDNEGDRLIVRDLLEETTILYCLTEAVNFREAEKLLSNGELFFDVILLDLTLPDKSGKMLIADTLKISSLCPIIILTGYADIDFSIHSISIGVSDYLIKDSLNAMTLQKSILYSIERKKSALNLEESEKRYSDLFNLSPQPMWVYQSDTLQFLQVNNAAVEQYGYSRQEFLTMTVMDIRMKESSGKSRHSLTEIADPERVKYSGLFKHYKKSGEQIDVEVFSNPIRMDDVDCRSAIAIDITIKNLFELKLTRAIIKTQEEERYEIGSELHDNVCQILAASLMSLSILKKSLKPSGTRWFDECTEYIRLSVNEIRNLSHRLAPAFFDQITLEEALKKLFDSLKLYDKYKIKIFIDEEMKKHNIHMDIQLSLYRILQELLSNIVKYSQAKQIRVDFNIHGDRVFMRVADDGVGYDMNTVQGGIGRANMKRRAALVSGRLDIESSPGNGCVVEVEIPLAESGVLSINA